MAFILRSIIFLLLVSFLGSVASGLPILSQDYDRRVRSFVRSGFVVSDSSKLLFKQAFEFKRKVRQNSGNGSVDISILIDRDSEWMSASNAMSLLEEEVLKTRNVLNQCGLDLKRIHVGVFELSEAAKNWLDPEQRDPYREPGEVPFMRVLTPPTKPLVLLVDGRAAFAYNTKSIQGLTRLFPSMPIAENISKVGWATMNGYNQRFSTQISFSLLAHEVVHIVGNVGHVHQVADNLMNTYSGSSAQDSGQSKSGRLEPWQCQKIIEHWID